MGKCHYCGEEVDEGPGTFHFELEGGEVAHVGCHYTETGQAVGITPGAPLPTTNGPPMKTQFHPSMVDIAMPGFPSPKLAWELKCYNHAHKFKN